jgi:hypothetical protein
VGVSLALLLYASSLPSDIEALVPALQFPAMLTIHVGMAVLSYGIFATAFAAGIGYLVQGQEDRFDWLPSHKTLDEVALPLGDHRVPDLRDDDHPRLLVGLDRLVALLGPWGPQDIRRARDMADVRDLPPRAQPAPVGGRPAALLLVVGFGMVLVTYSGSLWFSGLHAGSGCSAGDQARLCLREGPARILVPASRSSSACPVYASWSVAAGRSPAFPRLRLRGVLWRAVPRFPSPRLPVV